MRRRITHLVRFWRFMGSDRNQNRLWKFFHYLVVCLFVFSFQYTQVSENDPISLIKNLVSEKLGIPAVQQRLVFKGKTLAGNYRLHYDYFTLVQRHPIYPMLLVERNRALGPVQTPNVSWAKLNPWAFRAGAPSPLACLPLARPFFLAPTTSKRLLPRLNSIRTKFKRRKILSELNCLQNMV